MDQQRRFPRQGLAATRTPAGLEGRGLDPSTLDPFALGALAALAIEVGLLTGAGHIVADVDGPRLAVGDAEPEAFEAVAAAAWGDVLCAAD